MLRYHNICERPTQVLDLTSLLPNEFALIVPAFERCFQAHMDQWAMTGEPRTLRRHSTYANCPLPTAEDRLLFVLAYLKHAPTQAYHGTTFGLIQSSVSTWLNILIAVLRAALLDLGDAPSRTIVALRQQIGLDTTKRVQRPPFSRSHGTTHPTPPRPK
jgi:hypothetical protein